METGNLELLPEDVLNKILLLEENQQRIHTTKSGQTPFLTYITHLYNRYLVGINTKTI